MPWELEHRADALYWINEALTIQNGENMGHNLAMKVAQARSKSKSNGKAHE